MPVPSPAACGNGVHTICGIAQNADEGVGTTRKADEGVGTTRQPRRTANLVTDQAL